MKLPQIVCFQITSHVLFRPTKIVWAILNRTRYDNDAPEKVGIQRLVGKNIYTAAFPLHDGDYEKQDDKPDIKNERRVS